MKNLKLLAALLALAIGLAGCGKGGNPASSASKNKLDGDGMTAPSTQEQSNEMKTHSDRPFGNSGVLVIQEIP